VVKQMSAPVVSRALPTSKIKLPDVILQLGSYSYRIIERKGEDITSMGNTAPYGEVALMVRVDPESREEQSIIALVDDPESGDRKAYMLIGATLEGGLIALPGTRTENVDDEGLEDEVEEAGDEDEDGEDDDAEDGEDDDAEDGDDDEDEDDDDDDAEEESK
jgi:hypothetical protein